jgi:hypothetical protein
MLPDSAPMAIKPTTDDTSMALGTPESLLDG